MNERQRAYLDHEAHKVVFGSASARLRDEPVDVAVLLAGYGEMALDIGVPYAEAWALLFGAAITEFTDAVEDLADENEQSPEAELADRALTYQIMAEQL